MEYVRLNEIDLKGNLDNRIFVSFLVINVKIKLQKNGQKFIMFDMVDKDVVLEAKIFGASDEAIEKVKSGRVYMGAVDLKPWDRAPNGISGIVYNMDHSEMSPELFANWADNLDESHKTIERALAEIGDNNYRDIVYPILVENWGKFSSWTAALNQHHTKLGDLMTHTAEIIELATEVADTFNGIYGDQFINKSLLLSAIILHDLGKINELDVDKLTGETKYSDDSFLETHIMNVISMVDVQAYKLGLGEQEYVINEINEEEPIKSAEQLFDEIECVKLLKHCIASHHGKLEWGSPITPSIPEAHILHVVDNLDAEMYRYNETFNSMEAGDTHSVWKPNGLRKTYKDSTKIY